MSIWPGAGWLVWFSYASPPGPPTFVSPIGTQVDSPLQRQCTSLLWNGSIARIAAAVLGASSSSSRARNVNGPATIFSVFTSGARIGLASAAMATSLSTHVLDTAIGRPVSGVRVSLYRGTELVARGDTDADGRITELGSDLAAGSYRLLFAVKGPFFEEVALQMRLQGGHYHRPPPLPP